MATWAGFVSQVKALPAVKQRAVSAIVGAVVADSAAQSLFWIYDQEKIVKLLEGGKNPEFYEPCSNPFFLLPTGSQTMYGDFALSGLRATLSSAAGFNGDALKEEVYKTFGPNSAYEKVVQTGQYPIDGPYKSGAIKNFLKNYVAGDPTGANGNPDGEGLCATIPLIATMYDTQDVKGLCESSVKVIQDNSVNIENSQAACLILQTIIKQGDDPKDSVEVIKSVIPQFKAGTEAALRSVVSMNGSVSEVSKKFGLGCSMPQTLQAALYGIKGDTNYVKAVREAIIAGGNSSFRVIVIGACMGAKYGIDGIPEDWVNKLIAKDELLEKTLKLAEIMK